MALASPTVVRVEKQPGGLSIGETMNGIRSWLDHRQIEPASFKSFANALSRVWFEIGFNSEDEAHVFEREFNFARMLEAEIPRLRRYRPRQTTSMAARHGSASVALYHPAQSVCQRRPPFGA